MTDQHETPQAKDLIPAWLVAPVAALQFLTLCPPIVRRMFTSQEMGRAVGFFPLVGALLGVLLAGLDWLLRQGLPLPVSTILVLAASLVSTGALHLDGFLDACDGLFGGYTPESRMEIMRDERVGAFGLAGGVLLLLLKFTTLNAAPSRFTALFLPALLSRASISLVLVLLPYAREKGIGRSIKDHAGLSQAWLAVVTALLLATLAARWQGLAACGVAIVVSWGAARLALSKIPGLTGDIYGAISELVEAGILLFLATNMGGV